MMRGILHEHQQERITLSTVQSSQTTTIDASPDDKYKEILESILPKTKIKTGLNLYDYIKSASLFKISSQGEVIVDGRIVPSSNIVDIVNHMSRRWNADPPTGWNEIAPYLKSLNIPEAYIENNNLLANLRSTPTLESIQAHQRSPTDNSAQSTASISITPKNSRWTFF